MLCRLLSQVWCLLLLRTQYPLYWYLNTLAVFLALVVMKMQRKRYLSVCCNQADCYWTGGATVHLVQCSERCCNVSGLKGAHCSQGVILCTVCCFWVSDLDNHNRGPHQPVAVFFERTGQCFAEPFSGCPYFVCYPNCPTRGQSVICFSWVFCFWSIKD